jgi:hypothetical protein
MDVPEGWEHAHTSADIMRCGGWGQQAKEGEKKALTKKSTQSEKNPGQGISAPCMGRPRGKAGDDERCRPNAAAIKQRGQGHAGAGAAEPRAATALGTYVIRKFQVDGRVGVFAQFPHALQVAAHARLE